MNQWIKHQQPDADTVKRLIPLQSKEVRELMAVVESGKESLDSSQCTHNDFHIHLLSSVGPRQPLFSYKQHDNNQVFYFCHFSTTSAYSEFALSSFICNVTATHRSSHNWQRRGG